MIPFDPIGPSLFHRPAHEALNAFQGFFSFPIEAAPHLPFKFMLERVR